MRFKTEHLPCRCTRVGGAPDGGLHIVEREARHFGLVAVRRRIRALLVLMHACAGVHGVRGPRCASKRELEFTDTRRALEKKRRGGEGGGGGGRDGKEEKQVD